MPSEATPTLSAVLRTALESRLTQVHVALPGEVISFDATKRTVDVKPQIKRGYEAEDGSRAVESLPVIAGVPVNYPCGSLKGLTFPLAAGDTGLIVFTEASIDRWLAQGGEVDPGDDRRHNMSDAVFYPGLMPFNEAGLGIDASNVVIRTDTEIHAGGSQTLVLADALRSALDTLIGAIGGAVGTSGTPAGATASAATIATALTTFDTSYASTVPTSVLKGA